MIAKIERYLRQLAPHQNEREGPQLLRAAVKELNNKQAQIDALMLEWCPDEMTAEQLAEWGRHQNQVPNVKLRCCEAVQLE